MTAGTIVLCAVLPVMVWLLWILTIAQDTFSHAEWQRLVQDIIALFTTVEGLALLCNMFSPIALISLYFSVPLSVVIAAIYCCIKWRYTKR